MYHSLIPIEEQVKKKIDKLWSQVGYCPNARAIERDDVISFTDEFMMILTIETDIKRTRKLKFLNAMIDMYYIQLMEDD